MQPYSANTTQKQGNGRAICMDLRRNERVCEYVPAQAVTGGTKDESPSMDIGLLGGIHCEIRLVECREAAAEEEEEEEDAHQWILG